jgi:hypothetical protein
MTIGTGELRGKREDVGSDEGGSLEPIQAAPALLRGKPASHVCAGLGVSRGLYRRRAQGDDRDAEG